MVTGTVEIEVRLHACGSLKQKRGVMKKAIARIRSAFNVSAAETDLMDSRYSGCIGIAVVSNDRCRVNSLLDKICDFTENLHLFEVLHCDIEIL
jgi:hypothetical protein